MDLSYTAAWKLGYVDKGSAMVEVEAIVPGEVTMVASNTPPARSADIAPVDAIAAPPPDSTALAALPPDLQALASTADGVSATSIATPDILPRGIFLQLGAFNSSRNAESFRDYVQTELKWLKQGLTIIPDGDKFRLHAGPFDTLQDARGTAERIGKAIKLKPFVVQR